MDNAQFDEFWTAYPRRQAKGAARKKFMTLPSSLMPKILAAIEAQKVSKQWQEGFVPHPGTWLNQERWEDEVFEPEVDTKTYSINGKTVSKAEYEAYKQRKL